MGNFWTGQNVFSSGNLKLDLLHNFFLECGARANKIRVYEMAKDPTARAMVGFLLVRGGVHIVAYAKALEKLTGVDVGKLLPIPDISNKKFPEVAEARGRRACTASSTASAPTTTAQVGEIWNGPHPEDGQPLEVQDGPPKAAAAGPGRGAAAHRARAPDDAMIEEYAKRLFGKDAMAGRGGNGGWSASARDKRRPAVRVTRMRPRSGAAVPEHRAGTRRGPDGSRPGLCRSTSSAVPRRRVDTRSDRRRRDGHERHIPSRRRRCRS